MNTKETILIMLYISGVGQIFTALIYNWVRSILGWEADVSRMEKPWNRQIVQTYSRYIQGLNFSFGLITLLFAEAFFQANAIATALAAILALYWAGRLAVALVYYDTKEITESRPLFKVGAWGFNMLFVFQAITYSAVVLVNI
jgi:hypothetical protein